MCRKVTSAMKMINSMFEAENMDSKELSAKAKMLLASYRHVCWASIGFFRVGSEEQYMICDDDIDQALNYLVEFSPSEDKQVFESNLKALFDSKWMMELVDDAMVQVREFRIWVKCILNCFQNSTSANLSTEKMKCLKC